MDKSPETSLVQQLPSSYRSFAGSSDVPLNLLSSDGPHLLDRRPSSLSSLRCVCALSATFMVGVTVALLLRLFLDSLVVKGVVVSDHERCTALGHDVLHDGGSSVDAAVTAALCLGVVHPHVSGVGGGGVMLVHDVRKNQTRLIDFLGAAPEALSEELLLQSVSELKAGVQVGVPGELRGFHRAHSLYGRLSWEDVLTRAAAVAEEGFNVSSSLSEAISQVKGERLSRRFRDIFLPGGLALLPGSFLRRSSLAGVLQAGLSNFYDGNFSQELEEEVRSNGGVLSREDMKEYREQVEQPEEVLLNEFIIKVPRGAALSLLQRLHPNDTQSQAVTEALKYNSTVTERLSDALRSVRREAGAEELLQRIQASRFLQTEPLAGLVAVMGPDGLVVSVASSLSTPFGSRIITRSGVLLNSAILGLNRTSQKGRRPPSALMPMIVVPVRCRGGVYLALSSSGGQKSLTAISQVLISAPLQHRDRNRGLLPPSAEEVERNSVFQGILWSNDSFTALSASPSSDRLL